VPATQEKQPSLGAQAASSGAVCMGGRHKGGHDEFWLVAERNCLNMTLASL